MGKLSALFFIIEKIAKENRYQNERLIYFFFYFSISDSSLEDKVYRKKNMFLQTIHFVIEYFPEKFKTCQNRSDNLLRSASKQYKIDNHRPQQQFNKTAK